MNTDTLFSFSLFQYSTFTNPQMLETVYFTLRELQWTGFEENGKGEGRRIMTQKIPVTIVMASFMCWENDF